MTWSKDTIIALVTLFATCAPAVLFIWRYTKLKKNQGSYSSVLGCASRIADEPTGNTDAAFNPHLPIPTTHLPQNYRYLYTVYTESRLEAGLHAWNDENS
ncbi:hypothetical protein V8E51_004924 [Hyaloscypha variabilis]